MTRKEMKAVATIEYYLVYSIDWRVFIHVPCLVAYIISLIIKQLWTSKLGLGDT